METLKGSTIRIDRVQNDSITLEKNIKFPEIQIVRSFIGSQPNLFITLTLLSLVKVSNITGPNRFWILKIRSRSSHRATCLLKNNKGLEDKLWN